MRSIEVVFFDHGNRSSDLNLPFGQGQGSTEKGSVYLLKIKLPKVNANKEKVLCNKKRPYEKVKSFSAVVYFGVSMCNNSHNQKVNRRDIKVFTKNETKQKMVLLI